jgi:hypothetical protein
VSVGTLLSQKIKNLPAFDCGCRHRVGSFTISIENLMATLTRKELRALASVSDADERTCTRYLAGLRVHPDSAERIARALAALGLAPVGELDLAHSNPVTGEG